MKKGLSLSGGSTKIPALAGAAITLLREKKYKPDLITGISAGSILSLPLALRMYELIEKTVLNFELNDIFDIKPVNSRGNITLKAIWRIITGKESLGRQRNLRKTLSNLINESVFDTYKTYNEFPPVYIGYVDFRTGSRVFKDIKKATYDEYLDSVMASSSIPVFVESVKLNGSYNYDGGIRDHIASHWLMENYDLDEHVSIYSRPEDYNLTDSSWKPKNAYIVLQRTIDIMNTEISKNDELNEDKIAEEKGIVNTKIFMPYILSQSTYEIEKEKLKDWYEIGVRQTRKSYP